MSKRTNAEKLRRQTKKLFGWIESKIIDSYFIPEYINYIEQLGNFVQSYGSYNIDIDKFNGIQNKIENLLKSPDLSPTQRDSLESKFDLAQQLVPNLSKVSVKSFNYIVSLIYNIS